MNTCPTILAPRSKMILSVWIVEPMWCYGSFLRNVYTLKAIFGGKVGEGVSYKSNLNKKSAVASN